VPLLRRRARTRRKAARLHFDLQEVGSAAAASSFPILVPKPHRVDVRASRGGELVVRDRASAGTCRCRGRMDKVTVVGPTGFAREAPVRDGHAQIFGTRAGFYELYPVSASVAAPVNVPSAATSAASQPPTAARPGREGRAPRARPPAKSRCWWSPPTFKTRRVRRHAREGALARGQEGRRDHEGRAGRERISGLWMLFAARAITLIEWLTFDRIVWRARGDRRPSRRDKVCGPCAGDRRRRECAAPGVGPRRSVE